MAQFGQQALDWDPLILRDAFQEAFSCKLTQMGFDKLQAGVSLIGTNLFQQSIEVFLACTSLYANKRVRGQELPYVSLKDCCWAVFCYKELIGYDEKQDGPFDPDIVMYIQAIMNKDGISQLPQFMSFANLDDQTMTNIQENLVSDVQAFEAYNRRQQQEVNEIKAYIKDKQKELAVQLARFQEIMKNKEKGFKTAKK